MAAGDEQGWAPFPVQDWRRLPADPLRPAAAGPVRGTAHVEPDAEAELAGWSPVDPAWAPPARARPWWRPLVALLLVGALVTGGGWAARRSPEPRTDALRFVPADGAVAYDRVAETRELRTDERTTVTESARLAGTNALLSWDPALTVAVLHDDFDDPAGARLWRTVSTDVDERAGPRQQVRYYRVRGGVELAGELTDGVVTAYRPALVELPAEVRPGTEWSGEGTLGTDLRYRSRFRAAAGPDGCLDVQGELDHLDPAGQRRRHLALTRTWCPGQGVVAASESFSDLRTVQTRVPAPEPGERVTADTPVRWSAPADWRHHGYDTVAVGPDGAAAAAMNGSIETERTPVRTASGLVVRTMSVPTDLVATTPKTPAAWTSAWRAHPGGSITSVAAFGDVLLVTTSERRLVAYSAGGVRLWQRDLPEIAPSAAVRVDAADAVLVDLSGTVRRFAVADGTVRWERRLDADVNRAPAVGAGLVVLADRGGTVTVLDAASGGQRWTADLEAKGVAVLGGTVAVVQDQVLHGLDAGTGRHRFVRAYRGGSTDLRTLAGRLALASKEETLLLDPDGALIRTLPGYLALTAADSHLVGWSADRLDVLDPSGAVVATWSTPATSQVSSARPGLATPDGVFLFGYARGWTFDAWTRGG